MIKLNIENIELVLNGKSITLKYITDVMSKEDYYYILYQAIGFVFPTYYLIECIKHVGDYVQISTIYNVDKDKLDLFLIENSGLTFQQFVKESYTVQLKLEMKDTYKGELPITTNKNYIIHELPTNN